MFKSHIAITNFPIVCQVHSTKIMQKPTILWPSRTSPHLQSIRFLYILIQMYLIILLLFKSSKNTHESIKSVTERRRGNDRIHAKAKAYNLKLPELEPNLFKYLQKICSIQLNASMSKFDCLCTRAFRRQHWLGDRETEVYNRVGKYFV